MSRRPKPPLLTGVTQGKRNNIISKRQETKAAKMTGGNLPPGSGNKGIKGDVLAGYHNRIKIECKTTDKKSIRVQKDWLKKLENQCKYDGSEPVLMFGFTGKLGSYDWGAVPFDRLIELLEIEEAYYELKQEE